MHFSVDMLWLCILIHMSLLAAKKFPIVYVYTVVPAVCKFGLPDYIKSSLLQAAMSQPDCDVIMASNYKDCPQIGEKIENMTNIIKLDVTLISSNRTLEFANVSKNMFEADYGGELWITSALRFFSLEDIMISKGYSEMMHVEADNLLYGNMSSLLSQFRTGYPGLAATPLNSNKSFITASVLWIANLSVLKRFNDFLLNLGRNTNNEWLDYLTWLRPYGCCKHGGIAPDSNGQGIKPYAVNEMSMLAFYHHIRPHEFHLLPVVPEHKYNLNKYVCNMSEFGPNGREVGPPTGAGVWDPNSWGQYLGGTSRKNGRDKGFTDSSHIAGQAMRTSSCHAKMICAPEPGNVNVNYCVTAPHVRCNENSSWVPLWNLHVHSKHTKDYLSVECSCAFQHT